MRSFNSTGGSVAETDLNPNLLDTASPPIPEAGAWLSDYDGSLGPAINLSQAVPGDPPPTTFLDKIASAATSPEATRYGGIFGDQCLREAYAADVSRVYEASVAAEEVAITAGCNQAFFAAILALAAAGDAVLLPAPWYFNHKMTLDMLGIEARPLPLTAETGFVPDVETAAELLDDRVKAIVLVTPNNPTGAVYPAEVLTAFLELAQSRGVHLIVDETYRDFIRSTGSPHQMFKSPAWRETLISLYSFSKSFAIPGHRIGAITAAAPVINQIGKVLDCIQICPARAAQMALPWAMENLGGWRQEVNETIASRALAFQAALAPHKAWTIDQIGAYFAYVRHPHEGMHASQVAALLARSCGLLALPGSYFGPGQERHLRVAFANISAAEIGQIGDRLSHFPDAARLAGSQLEDYRHG